MIGEQRSKEELLNELIHLRQRCYDLEQCVNSLSAMVEAEPYVPVIYDEPGSIISTSRRMRAQEALQKSEYEKAWILNSITDAFYRVNSEWQVTYWNKAAEKMYKIKSEDIIGWYLWDVFPDSLGQEYYWQYNLAMTERQAVAFETLGPRSHKWMEVRVYPSQDGLAIFAHDISPRKQAEEALRQSEEQFMKAFRASPVMTSIMDGHDNRYIEVNDSWLEAFGLCREEVTGRTAQELELWVDEPAFEDVMREFLAKKRLYNYEISYRNASGEICMGLASLETVHIHGKNCYMQAMVDITSQKKLEKEMARLERLNLIGEMAASIGHEIRNPLTAIRGFLQMLGDKQQYREDHVYFDIMIEELDRANGIISEYLGMAKGKKVNLQPESINEIISSLYPIIQSDANYREMNVLLDAEPTVRAEVDVNEIRQLILNMARNSIDAMKPGGTLTLGTRVESDAIVLFIKDEGSGVPAEIQEKLGTPFVTTKEKGTGLGLAVCFGIAARHKASIDYETGPGGTTFFIKFPRLVEPLLLF